MQLSLPVKSFPLMLTMVFILVTLWGLSYRYSGTVQGEVAERSKAAVLKTVEGIPLPGFESLSLRFYRRRYACENAHRSKNDNHGG